MKPDISRIINVYKMQPQLNTQ